MVRAGGSDMVGAQTITNLTRQDEILPDASPVELPEDELRWCTATLNEVLQRGKRLEARVFGIEGKHAHEVLKQCKWPIISIWGKEPKLANNVFVPGRVKRIYLHKDDPDVIGFLGSSEMLDIYPIPYKWLSRNEDKYNQFKIEKEEVLISCSGTIGNLAYVSETLARYMVSQHAIRIVSDYPGYIYSFLRTDVGKSLVKTNTYGAVVSEIEPEHFARIPIPNPPETLKRRIHDLIVRSYALRDESNNLLDKAKAILYDILKLPPLEELPPHYFDQSARPRNYTVNLSDLAGRLDGSYHIPLVNAISRQLEKEAKEITTIGDPRISKQVILPGRFARVYVEEGQGTVFFGGKQLFELDPANKKYLSLAHHADRIKRELLLKKNMILITRSGTIGKVALVPEHWEQWVVNEHVIRVEPATSDIAGYLYVFLATDYGRELITRFTYGAVVDEINDYHVSQVQVPLLKDAEIQAKINRLALEANAKRTEAYHAEQEALRITNEEIIHAIK